MKTNSAEAPVTRRQEDAERRKHVRPTTLLVTLVVLFFYSGFVALMLVRATR